MKKNAGYAIIIVGLFITIFSGLNAMHKDVLLETENFSISREKDTNMTWLPLGGIVVIAIGGLLIYNGLKNEKSMS